MSGWQICALAAWLWCLPSQASAPNYFTRLWQTDDGLPQNAVTAIVQARDGYLWIGTYSGLARFDGVHFSVFNNNNTPQMYSSRVTSLYEDSNGVLWIGCETGELTRYQDGTFQAVKMPTSWKGRKILAINADSRGNILVLGSDGTLVRLPDGLNIPSESAGTAEMGSLVTDRNGATWVLWNGRASRLDGGRLMPVQFGSEPLDEYVQGICASREGGLWVVMNGRARKWERGEWTKDRGESPWGVGPAMTAFLETRAGSLAAGVVDHGLGLKLPGGGILYYNLTNGLPSDWIRSLCEDREGDLWVGTGNGLVELRPGKVATVNAPDHWQGRAVLSVTRAPDDSLWIGTEGAGLYHLHQGHWTQYGTAEGVSNLFVWSVSEDAQGRLWAGTWGGGLLVQQGNHFAHPPGLETDTVPMPALLQGRNGNTWIGTGAGLLHYRAGKVNHFGLNRNLVFPDVRAVIQAPDGTVWFGMLGGGLGRLKDGKVRQFRKADGLSTDFVQCLHLEPDGTLWIGTFGGGLDRLKAGHFAVVNTSQGLPNDVVCAIEDDKHGNFWCSSHGGIFRVSKQQLNACADGRTNRVHCLTLDKGDGLPTLECSGGFQPSSCVTSDGRLWFPTSKGLVAVNPNEIKINHLPPPVVLEELLVDDRRVPLAAARGRPLRIAPGHNRFEFRYAALSFVAPQKVRFKYRIEGLETDWVDGGTKRAVNYSFVPPGQYTFHVIACNNDGIWNDSGASLSFIVLPHFWQTLWFRTLVATLTALAIGGAVWFATRRRMRLKLERLERQRAVERERTRIAKDIHDDLGASLTRITLLSQSARGELDNPGRAATNLDRIYGTARELTRAMDEIVWAVNPQHDTLDSLASYLSRFAQDYLGAANIRCRLDLPVQLPAWPLSAETRHNLFLAFKEALHNVVKHAAASEVRVSLRLKPPGFLLNVEDNGRGFMTNSQPASPPSTTDRFARGNGLANMRRRLAEIGGSCELQSTVSQGTTVALFVPVTGHHPEAN